MALAVKKADRAAFDRGGNFLRAYGVINPDTAHGT
jgi:hypothetical protein